MISIMDRIMVGFAVLMFLVIVLVIPYSVKKQDDFEIACKEAGGIAYTATRSFNLCLNPTAIVELK